MTPSLAQKKAIFLFEQSGITYIVRKLLLIDAL
jgi:hypothetical protein